MLVNFTLIQTNQNLVVVSPVPSVHSSAVKAKCEAITLSEVNHGWPRRNLIPTAWKQEISWGCQPQWNRQNHTTSHLMLQFYACHAARKHLSASSLTHMLLWIEPIHARHNCNWSHNAFTSSWFLLLCKCLTLELQPSTHNISRPHLHKIKCTCFLVRVLGSV